MMQQQLLMCWWCFLWHIGRTQEARQCSTAGFKLSLYLWYLAAPASMQ